MFEQLAEIGFSNLQFLDFLVQDVGAEDLVDGRGATFLGGVGNLISAALQTKGLQDQAYLLVKFEPILEWIAALAWLCSIVFAIFSFAVFGRYKESLYLLIGPPLFYFMITVSASHNGVSVRIGDRIVEGSIQDNNELLTFIRAKKATAVKNGNQVSTEVAPNWGEDGGYKVSLFFATIDMMATEIIHSLVEVLLDTENKQDLKIIARENMRSFVLRGNSVDPGFVSLFVAEHLGKCAESMQRFFANSTEVNMQNTEGGIQEANQPSTRKTNEKALKAWDKQEIELEPASKDYITAKSGQSVMADDNILKNYEADRNFPKVNFQINQKGQETLSCKQIWEWTRAAVFYETAKTFDPKVLQGNMPLGDYPWDDVTEEVANWFSGGSRPQLKEDGTPSDEFGEDGPSANSALDVAAVYFYKNMIRDINTSALHSNISDRVILEDSHKATIASRIGDTYAHGGFMKIRYLAMFLPYLQGVLLYLLSISFPLFAIFLVVPGQWKTFLSWVGLYVWVKSWDLGGALVMVVREVLWSVMHNRANIHETKVNWEDPIAVVGVAFNNDPFYSENTYWIIVSALTVIIPAMTAHLFKGATQMLGSFDHGLNEGLKIGNMDGNSIRRMHANAIERKQATQMFRTAQNYGNFVGRHKDTGLMDGRTSPMGDLKSGYLKGNLGSDAMNTRGRESWAAFTMAPTLMFLKGHAHSMLGWKTDEQRTEEVVAQIEKGGNGAGVWEKEEKTTKDGVEKTETRNVELPQNVHSWTRGMIGPSRKLDRKALVQWVKDTKEVHGRGSSEYRRTLGILRKYDKDPRKNNITVGQFFQIEKKRSNDIGLELTGITRRQQFVISQNNTITTFQGALNARILNVTSARSAAAASKGAAVLGQDGVNRGSTADNAGVRANPNLHSPVPNSGRGSEEIYGSEQLKPQTSQDESLRSPGAQSGDAAGEYGTG